LRYDQILRLEFLIKIRLTDTELSRNFLPISVLTLRAFWKSVKRVFGNKKETPFLTFLAIFLTFNFKNISFLVRTYHKRDELVIRIGAVSRFWSLLQ
jgi:hypothetical protein